MPRRKNQVVVYFTIPDNLDLSAIELEHPPHVEAYKRDVAAMLLENLYLTLASSESIEDTPNQYVRLTSDILRETIHDLACQYMNWLIEAKVIERRIGRYRATSSSFRFSKQFRSRAPASYECRDPRTVRKVRARAARSKEATIRFQKGMSAKALSQFRQLIEPYRQDLLREIGAKHSDNPPTLLNNEIENHDPFDLLDPGASSRTSFDVDAALSTSVLLSSIKGGGIVPISNNKFLDRLHEHLRSVQIRDESVQFVAKELAAGSWSLAAATSAHAAINRIRSGAWTFSRNPKNYRLDTNITGLKRELRQFLVLGGRSDLWQIDIRTSQPFFLIGLARMLAKHFDPTAPSLDAIAQWSQSVTGGDLYAGFAQHLGFSGDDARELGKLAVMYVLYSSHHDSGPNPIRKIFKEIHPEIYAMVVAQKTFDHTELANMLCRMEAHVMLDRVAATLVSQGVPLLTVHDCLILPRAFVEQAQETIARACESVVRAIPLLHVNPLSAQPGEVAS